MERSSQVLQHRDPKLYFFFQKISKLTKLNFFPYLEKRNCPRFVNISPTLVIDTTMGMSLWVATTAWKPKNWMSKKFEIEFCPYSWVSITQKINHPGFVNISPTLVIDSYINGKVFTSTTTWKPNNLIFFKNVQNWI